MQGLILEATPPAHGEAETARGPVHGKCSKGSATVTTVLTHATEPEDGDLGQALLSLSEPVCKRGTLGTHCEGCSKGERDDVFREHGSQRSGALVSLVVLFITLVVPLVPKQREQPGCWGTQGQLLQDAKALHGAGGGWLCWTKPPTFSPLSTLHSKRRDKGLEKSPAIKTFILNSKMLIRGF